MYKDINVPESLKGIKFWQNPKNKFHVLMCHYTADPGKDPERDGKEWYEAERESKPLAKWQKEYEIDFTTKSGSLIFGGEYCDFDQNIHFIDSFEIEGEQLFSLDFGQSNPNAGYVAVYDRYGTIYVVDEYYKPAIPSVAAREMFRKFAHWMGKEPEDMDKLTFDRKRDLFRSAFQIAVIDPTTRSKNRTAVKGGEEIPFSVIEDFYDNGMDFEPGNNDWEAGITRIREYFQLKNGKSHLYIFKDKCPNLCDEIVRYKYKEQTKQQERVNNKPDRPIKKHDHGIDSLRYLIMTRPNKPEESPAELTPVQLDIQRLIKPINISSLWDND